MCTFAHQKPTKNMHQNYIKYNTKTASKSTPSFTGKERDSETGFSYFGARYYDSDLMTGWLSVDPMADKYPSLSPYAYCGWNPIKLVDPDGEAFRDPPISRITVCNGYVVLNMNNLHSSTRSRINTYNNNTRNWPPGSIGAFRPLARVENKMPEFLSPQGGYGYSQPSNANIRTKAVNAKSTGIPDRRVKPHIIASNGSKGGNIAIVAINAVNYTLNAITAGLWNNDIENAYEQTKMLGEALGYVEMYDKYIGLNEEYRTPEEMLNIANYVFQKENLTTKDKNYVKEVGDRIRYFINYKFNSKVKQCEE